MNDFVHLVQIARDAVNAGALPVMFVFYGGALAIGVIGAKIGFALSRWIGIAGTIGALAYLYHLATWSNGIVVPVVLPQAWIAWGIILYCTHRVTMK